MAYDSHTALKLVTASTGEPVSVAQAKSWLRLSPSHVADDDDLSRLISAARRRFEDKTNRAALRQTFDWYLDRFPCDDEALRPPRAPLLAVTSIKYFTDTDGVTDTGGRTMSSSEYVVDIASEPGRIVPLGSYSWPEGSRTANAGLVRFDAGYSSQSTGVPEHVQDTILSIVAYLYEHRGEELPRDTDGGFALPPEIQSRLEDVLLPEWG
jgi:uncharacterized phiE125 gp8 family phage protein